MLAALVTSRGASSLNGCIAKVQLVLSVALLAGCAAQANLAGTVEVTEKWSGRANGRVRVQGNAAAAASGAAGATTPERIAIRFEKGQLHIDHGEVLFELDSDKLKGDRTFESLGQLRDHLKAYPKVKIRVEGHTDSRGTDEYNADLSRRRANSVMKWLVDQGVEADRLSAKGFGERKPEVAEGPCKDGPKGADEEKCEAEVWSKNRRVEYPVLEGADSLPAGVVAEKAVEEKAARAPVVEPAETPPEAPPEPTTPARCGRVGLFALGNPYVLNATGAGIGGGLEIALGCRVRVHGSVGYLHLVVPNGDAPGVTARLGLGLPLHLSDRIVLEPRLGLVGVDAFFPAGGTATDLHSGAAIALEYEWPTAYVSLAPGVQVGWLGQSRNALPIISVPVQLSAGLRF